MTRRFPVLPPIVRHHPASLLVAALALSCIGDASGPGASRPGLILLQPAFVHEPPRGVVTIASAHVTLTRPRETEPALDTTVNVTATDSTLEMTLRVPVLTQADTFQAMIELLGPGDVVLFQAGPLTVVGYPAQGTRPPEEAQRVDLAYVGIGADAATVEITTTQVSRVLTGDTVVLAAVAKRADGTVIPGTPIGWSSLDPLRATVPAAGTPRIVGANQRGDARIVAELFTGQKDTVLVPVHLLPAVIAPVSGSGQTAIIRSLLPQPLVARARASDSMPVAGIWLRFLVTAGGGTLTADSALTDANGEASTTWTLGPLAGAQQVRVTSSKTPTLQATFGATALAGAAVNVGIAAGNNQTGVVGTAVGITPAVVVKDADSNVVQGAGVTFAVTSGGGSLTAASQTTDASGVARVGSWTLGTVAGSNSITATISTQQPVTQADPAGVETVAMAPLVTVVTINAIAAPGPAADLLVGGLTSPVIALPNTFGVVARDQYGNVATAYQGSIHFTSTDLLAVLPADYTFTAADNGAHQFIGGLTFGTGGTQTVTATDMGTASITGSQTVSVGGGGANTFAITGLPGSTVAGPNYPITVTARDPSGNTITTYTGMVYLTSTDPVAALPEPYQFQALDNGTHTFDTGVAFHTAGSHTLTATDVTQGGFSGTSPAVTVSHTTLAFHDVTGVADSLVDGQLFASPGVPFSVTVAARDSFGNTIPGYAGTITFSAPLDVANPVLPAPYTFVPATDQGVHAFAGVTLNTNGSQYILVEDQDAVPGILQVRVGVAAPATQLAFLAPPTNTAAGATMAPVVVAALDATSQVATGFDGDVTIVIGTNPSSGTLAGTTTMPAVNGYATFEDLSINNAGSGYTLTGSAPGLTSTTSAAFDILPPTPTVHWTGGGGDGLWSTGTNWDAGRPPLSTEAADISLDGTYNVTLDVSPTLEGLTLGASIGTQTLTATSRTITLNGLGSVGPNGSLSLTNSTITGAGVLTNLGTADIGGGSVSTPLANYGLLLVTRTVSINGTLTQEVGSTLRIQGAAGFNGALTVANGFANLGAIDLTDAGGYTASLAIGSGTLTNAPSGTITASLGGNGARTLTAELDNQGLVTLARPLTINGVSAAHANYGTIAVTGGALTLTQSGTTPSFTNAGTITLASDWTVSGGTLDLTAGTVTGAGLTSVANATLVYSFASLPDTLSLNTVTIPAGLTIPQGETLTLLSSDFNAAVTIDGTLITRRAVTLGGTVTTGVSTGAILRVEGGGGFNGALTVTNGFTNTGAIELTDVGGYTATLAGGPLINAPAGTITALLGGNGGRILTVELDNQGLLTLARPLTINGAGAAHTNSGTIALTGGNLTLTAATSFTNASTGVVTLTNDWSVNGGTLDLINGTVTGAGLLSVTSATLQYSFASLPDTLSLNTVTIPAGLTIPEGETLTLLTSDFSAPVTIDGTLITRRAVTLGGTVTTGVATGAILRVEGGGGFNGALTVTNGFTNTGAIELTDVGGYTATLAGGPLINAPAGTITALLGGNGGRILTVELDNQGLVTLARPLTINGAGAAHTNSGTIALTGGGLTLSLATSFTNTGTVTLTNDWTVTGGTLDLTAGTVTGAGLLSVTSATLQYAFASLPGTMSLTGVTIPAGLTIPQSQTLTLHTSNFDAAVTVNGTLIIERGVTLSGTVTTGSGTGAIIQVLGSSGFNGALTVTNGFTNTADIELTDVGGYSATLTVSTGTLTNAAAGSITALTGGNGPRTLAAALLDNSGTLQVNRSLTVNGAIDQRNIVNVPATQTLTVSGVLTLFSGSVTTINGTLVYGSCTNSGGSITGGGTYVPCP